MKVLKALVFDAAGKTPPTICDAIEYRGQLWLVPGWYEISTKAVSKPVRLIPLDPSAYQMIPGEPQADLVVNAGLPTQLFDPEIPTELRNKFQVVESPDIEIPAGGGRIQ
jgi:hypothetical protein